MRNCFPIISFLHVPGKMSRPLWLMLGTAVHIAPPPPPGVSDEDVAALESSTNALCRDPSRLFFLTTKHTFAPWDHVKDPAEMKVPVEFRKQRYVVSRMYDVDEDTHRACRERYVMATLLASHPTLDIAVLSVLRDAPYSGASSGDVVTANSRMAGSSMRLMPDAPPADHSASFLGFRAEGRLGQLDTLDPSLLQTLPPQEREKLLKDLQDVEGRQIWTECRISVLSHLGAAACQEGGECYHGMSGSPLVVNGMCGGILYGKHPDYPHHMGYTPICEVYSWLQQVLAKMPA
eukprot:gene10652-7399_t